MASTIEQPTLRLVPPLDDAAVWAQPQPTTQAVWLPLLKRWGPPVAVGGVLLMAAYWGPARGPLFR